MAKSVLFSSAKIVLLSCSIHAAAAGGDWRMDETRFHNLTVRNGLSESTVDAIVQDRQGFLWFGTMDGLNRYDGYDFRTFRNNPSDSTSISDNWINVLLADSDGSLWIGTEHGGLCRYDPVTEKFTVYKYDPRIPGSLPANNVFALCKDARGNLWVGLIGGGLCRMDSSGRGFHRHQYCPVNSGPAESQNVTSIMEDSHGDLWLGTSSGLFRLRKEDRDSCRFTQSGHPPLHDPWNVTGTVIPTIAEDHNGDMWLGVGDRGLYRYSRATGVFARYQHGMDRLSDDWIRCIHEDHSGRLWVGTWNGGLNVRDPGKTEFRHYKHDAGNDESLNSDVVISLCEDAAGGMWFGTLQGISSLDGRRKQFHQFRHRPFDHGSISDDNVEDVKLDPQGGIWVASRGGGLDYLPPGAKAFTRFHHNPADMQSISSDQVICISCRTSKTVWVGTRDRGLSKLNTSTGRFTRYVHDPDRPASLGEDGISMLFEEPGGNLWVGTNSHGLDRLRMRTGKFEHYRHDPKDSTTISGDRIWCIDKDRTGNLWVGTWGAGLNRLNRDDRTFTRYMNRPGDSTSLVNDAVYSLLVDSTGVLWAGTSGGLCKFDEPNRRFISYREQDGLPDNNICAMLADKHGFLWISTDRGLSRFDPRTRSFRNFDQSDGLQNNEFQQNAVALENNGWMFFGGVEGISFFHPDSIHDNNYIPPVVLTHLRVLEQHMLIPGCYEHPPAIALYHNQNFFSLEFAALSYTAPARNLYRYRLDGFDKEWVSCGSRRYAAYTNLDPGEYVFHVQGSNNDGVWNTDGASLAISIVPPFWKTWWFYGLTMLALGSVITGLIQRRFAFLKRRAAEHQEVSRRILESQENERKRIGASLHDSLGQNLLIIKNLAAMAGDAERDRKTIESHVGRISTLASQALAEVRDIAYDLRPYQLDRLGLTGALRSIADRLAASSTINVKIDLDDVDGLLPKDQEIHLFRIVQEAINNILKHSHATSASIEVRAEGNRLFVVVMDNGIGFDSRQVGFGLSGMAERARILGASLALESKSGLGTTITAKIPLGRSSQ